MKQSCPDPPTTGHPVIQATPVPCAPPYTNYVEIIKRMHVAIFETLFINCGILGLDKVIKALKTETRQHVKSKSIGRCKEVHSTKSFFSHGSSGVVAERSLEPGVGVRTCGGSRSLNHRLLEIDLKKTVEVYRRST